MNVINNTVPVKICCLVWNVLKALKKVKCKMWFDSENQILNGEFIWNHIPVTSHKAYLWHPCCR